MNFLKIPTTFLVFFCFSLCLPLQAQITWDGGGDGVHWDDPLNWDGDTEPTASDNVDIPAGDSVVIRVAGEVCAYLQLFSADAVLNVLSGADLTSGGGANSGGIDLIDDCRLYNSGTININDMDNSREGIDLGPNSVVDNMGDIMIDGLGVSSGEGIELAENSIFYNRTGATLSVVNTNNELICADGRVYNDGTMTLTGNATNNDGIELENDNGDEFINNGTITLLGTLDSGEPLDLDGPFTNNGTINIQMTMLPGEALIVRDDGSLTNSMCGVVNILANSDIDIEDATGVITNDGIIATVFTGMNTNNGVFTNNSTIHTTDGNFNISPNALQGAGTVIMGPVPASTLCVAVAAIPTLGQWGLILLSLLILTFGLVTLGSRETVLAGASGISLPTKTSRLP